MFVWRKHNFAENMTMFLANIIHFNYYFTFSMNENETNIFEWM